MHGGKALLRAGGGRQRVGGTFATPRGCRAPRRLIANRLACLFACLLFCVRMIVFKLERERPLYASQQNQLFYVK
jgi:hypothetical protein